jgi:hypothetical protein
MMKRIIAFIILAVVCFGLQVGCAKENSTSSESIKNPEVATQLKSFVAEKEAQANAAAKADGKGMPPEYKTFFAAAEKGDWLTISNMFWKLGGHNGAFDTTGPVDFTFRGGRWEAAKEIWGAFCYFGEEDEKYSTAFGNDIIDSIPPGSVYFGGTDPGRFIITAMSKSQISGDPFFTLTQNALADMTYLNYLRSMYGDKIYIPTAEDSQKCFQDYIKDAQRRMQNHQLKPGENVNVDAASGRVQISGSVAVMEINALLVKVIFDKNPNREFYIEESWPLDWMYPYLEPHGLIFKINRQPLAELSNEIVQRDHDYWTKYVQPMIGNWLNDDTSVEEVTKFAGKVFLQHDFNGFAGDPLFIQNDYSCKMFSKLRSSIGGLYAWRAQHAADASEKERMNNESDFAFRQAFALCPYSPEVVFQYVNLLMSEGRTADALFIAETAEKMPEMQGNNSEQVRGLIQQLKQYQNQKGN